MTAAFAVHHTGLVVDDLDAAECFYVSQFGFESEGRTEWTVIDGAPLGIDAEKVELRWVFLSLAGTRLEVHEFRDLPVSSQRRNTQDRGLGHLAVRVNDMDIAVANLSAAGIEFFSAPNLLTDSPGQEGDRWVYGRDPFGLTIELYEVASEARGHVTDALQEKGVTDG